MSTTRALASIVLAGAALGLAATPALGDVTIEPSVSADRFRAVWTGDDGRSTIAFDGPDRFAVRPAGGIPQLGSLVRDRGLETSRFGTSTGTVVRRTFAAAPDGFSPLDFIDTSTDVLLARARAGATPLRRARIGGVDALRGQVRLGANDCAGLRGGVRTIHLDARTLLPLRIVTRRAGEPHRTTGLRYPSINGPLPARTFRPVAVGPKPFREDRGFRRVGPAKAAAALIYAPRLPAFLPDGFRLVVTGWAPRSGSFGPEGSIPPHRQVFAAVYARGGERIELTQRLAQPGGWPTDPFAGECEPLTQRRVDIGGRRGTYGIGPQTSPHLYWQAGRVLHTLSGPFPPRTLIAIAESLAPAG